MKIRKWFRKKVGTPTPHPLAPLVIAALGVVYGDIGTSPLYAFKECFYGPHGMVPSPENVLGVLSLFVWAIILDVVFKYLTFITRANNNGEGGIMALLAVLTPRISSNGRQPIQSKIVLMGLFGAALLYGDGMITPAISVLSAVEGLEVATPVFQPYIVPITVVILIGLFMAQKGGTAKIGAIFGPATLIWFVCIAAIAIPWIIRHPEVFLAFNPMYGVRFFMMNGLEGFLILGAVVLCITGSEALYADMGHFGIRPIRFAWYTIVMPALILNYFGQAALVLEKGAEVVKNPFYAMVPSLFLYPMVAIATVATVIASQALISGAFSLTNHATQLGYFPRFPVVHTSEHTEGQIFIPRVNQLLMLSCIALVLIFQESSNLAAAYGMAVTMTMVITSILFYFFTRKIWGWPVLPALGLVGLFLVVDLAFFGANLAKLLHGGWVPLAIAGVVFLLMTTWRMGRSILSKAMLSRAMPLKEFTERVEREKPHRVQGSAVFMTPNTNIAPSMLLHHFKHNQVLHERVVLLTIQVQHVPAVPFYEHARMTDLGNGIYQIISSYGYMQRPNVFEILNSSQLPELQSDRDDISFYLGRETLLTTGPSKMKKWRKKLFSLLSRNAQPATAFFEIPPDRVIEIGLQLEL